MQVFHALAELKAGLGPCGVAVGNFDGVHLGHQSLLKRLVRDCHAHRWRPAILTFYPHPVEVLNPGKRLERLTTTTEKLDLLESLGFEVACVARFDKALAALEPEAFFEQYLEKGLQAKHVAVGYNFRFGRQRRGDTKLLAELGKQRGMGFHEEPPFTINGVRVSSSAIREEIGKGDIQRAAELLGRPYFMTGTVVSGEGNGKQLGFPTANLKYSHEKLVPANGVYVSRVLWQKQVFRSVTNVGVRPTLSKTGKVSVETHILDFNTPLVDEALRVDFLQRIRDEKKFASLEELRAQIQRDVETARHYLG